jgi:SPP1 family predicted phage head-tail adaptor
MIGEFDEIITLYAATHSVNSSGQPTKTYSQFARAFAKVEQKGSENVENDSVVFIPRIELTMHYQTGIKNDMRLEYDGENYDIQDIERIENRKYLRITAEKENV